MFRGRHRQWCKLFLGRHTRLAAKNGGLFADPTFWNVAFHPEPAGCIEASNYICGLVLRFSIVYLNKIKSLKF
jgi:hypothetical protein